MFIDYKTNGTYIRKDPMDVENALADVDIVKGMKAVDWPSKMLLMSHALLHMKVGKDSNGLQYQFFGLVLASDYVGQQLWIRHSKLVMERFIEFYAGSPNEVSRRLLEIYGHLVLSKGGVTLRCRDLRNETEFMLDLDALDGQ